jgi:hypothetical protein
MTKQAVMDRWAQAGFTEMPYFSNLNSHVECQ